MSWDKGFNFRATSGYATDGTNETYCINDAYPTTRNSVTFGYASTGVNNTRDRNSALDRRVAGTIFPDAGSQANFQVDLTAAGSYTVTVFMTDANAGHNNSYVELFDNASSLDILYNNVNFGDNGTDEYVYQVDKNTSPTATVANISTHVVTANYTFSSTTFKLRTGGGGFGTTPTAHVFLSQNAAAGALPKSIFILQGVNRSNTY